MGPDFASYRLPADPDWFAALAGSAELQAVGKGRYGSVLVRPDPARGVPIVRTTTRYDVPAQCFGTPHVRLAAAIAQVASLPLELNNGLIERYTHEYTKMGFHSDQALDLVEGSFIAVFSCYRTPPAGPAHRRLVVQAKPAYPATRRRGPREAPYGVADPLRIEPAVAREHGEHIRSDDADVILEAPEAGGQRGTRGGRARLPWVEEGLQERRARDVYLAPLHQRAEGTERIGPVRRSRYR